VGGGVHFLLSSWNLGLAISPNSFPLPLDLEKKKERGEMIGSVFGRKNHKQTNSGEEKEKPYCTNSTRNGMPEVIGFAGGGKKKAPFEGERPFKITPRAVFLLCTARPVAGFPFEREQLRLNHEKFKKERQFLEEEEGLIQTNRTLFLGGGKKPADSPLRKKKKRSFCLASGRRRGTP